MIEVALSSSFKRAYRHRISGNKGRENAFQKRLKLFCSDPFDKKLRTHKLSGKLSQLWSFSVEYDLRIVFYFVDDKHAVLVDIGTHNDVY